MRLRTQNSFRTDDPVAPLVSDVVNLKAQYGLDTDDDGIIDAWQDAATAASGRPANCPLNRSRRSGRSRGPRGDRHAQRAIQRTPSRLDRLVMFDNDLGGHTVSMSLSRRRHSIIATRYSKPSFRSATRSGTRMSSSRSPRSAALRTRPRHSPRARRRAVHRAARDGRAEPRRHRAARSADTATIVAGNLAFKQAAAAAVDRSVEQAVKALFDPRPIRRHRPVIADKTIDTLAQNYFCATCGSPAGDASREIPDELQSVSAFDERRPERRPGARPMPPATRATT